MIEATQTERWNGRSSFESAVVDWAERIGVQAKAVAFRPMSKKWASCSSEGRLTFNLALLEEPRDFGEAVIVHELLHLLVPNHGRLFQSLLGAYCPNWRSIMGDRAACGALR